METKKLTDRISPTVVVAVWLLFFAAIIFASCSKPIGDFGNYYFGGHFLLQGSWGTWIYETYLFNLKVYQTGFTGFFGNCTPLPPLTFLLFAPLSVFEPFTAKLIWNIVSALFFLFTLYRICRQLNIPFAYTMLSIPIFLLPLYSHAGQGQAYLFLFALMGEGYLAHSHGKKWLTAFLWSLCIVLKLFPAVLLLFLVSEKQFRTLFYTLAFAAGWILISLPFIGCDTWIFYGTEILPRVLAGDLNNNYSLMHQSMQTLLRNLFVPDAMHNTNAYVNAPALYSGLSMLFKVVVLALALAAGAGKTASTQTKLAFWLLSGSLVSGYGSTYSLCLLLLPLLLFLNPGHLKKDWLVLLLVFLLCNIPLYMLQNAPVLLQYPRLLLLIVLWCTWLLRLKPVWHSRYWIFAAAPVLSVLYFTPAGDPYYLQKEEALLIYDFRFVKNTLLIDYFDGSPKVKSITLGDEPQTIEPISFDRHHLGKQERRNENILKALLVDNAHIVYLTDLGRGTGFYTLRFTPVQN